MDEAVLREGITQWPVPDGERQHAALAHKHLCATDPMPAAMGMPLRNRDGHSIGAIVILAESAEALAGGKPFLQAAEKPIATTLHKTQQLEGGRLGRISRSFGGFLRSRKGSMAAVITLVTLAATMVPIRYKIRCDCQIEPVIRRFVAAPHDGTLEKSLVNPGDYVTAGDVVARMDGREIEWQRASVMADMNQSIKKRDAAQVGHSYAEAQIAELEMQRLQQELSLLDHRAEHLEIRSPIARIVASGDLERAEGAPLTVGQTLFEIAPLGEMIIEVAVPDEEVSFIRTDQPIHVRLDALPGEVFQATVDAIQPRSEIRDERNAFIAEGRLDNTDGRLRPGMKGRAKVVAPRRMLGWVLFHRPIEYFMKMLSW